MLDWLIKLMITFGTIISFIDNIQKAIKMAKSLIKKIKNLLKKEED